MLRADDESATENSNDAQSKWIVTDADADGIDSAALLSDDDEGKLQFKRGKPGRILLSDDEGKIVSCHVLHFIVFFFY